MAAPELTNKEQALLANAWKCAKTTPDVCSLTAAPCPYHWSQITDIFSSMDRLTGRSSPASAATPTREAERTPWRKYILLLHPLCIFPFLLSARSSFRPLCLIPFHSSFHHVSTLARLSRSRSGPLPVFGGEMACRLARHMYIPRTNRSKDQQLTVRRGKQHHHQEARGPGRGRRRGVRSQGSQGQARWP